MKPLKYCVTVKDEQTGIEREMTIGLERQSEMQDEQVEQVEQADQVLGQTSQNEQQNSFETSPEMCLELSKAEYEHSIRRSEKLDNKVYILLTVCGFIFVMLVNAISNIESIEILNFKISGWIVAYDILLVVTSFLTVILLACLIYCLSGIELKRYDSNLTYEMNLTSLDKTTVAKFAIFEYEIAKKHNNDLISKRFDKVNVSVKILIAVVILLILLSVSGSFAKIATTEYHRTIEHNQERNIDDVIEEIERDTEYIRLYLQENNSSNVDIPNGNDVKSSNSIGSEENQDGSK